MQKFNRIRQVAPMCPCGTTRCRHLSNNTVPSVYGGDAPYGKLLWPFVIFGHADYTVAQIANRFEPSTVLWAFHTIQPSSFLDVSCQSHSYQMGKNLAPLYSSGISDIGNNIT